jgi:hypothetical protein
LSGKESAVAQFSAIAAAATKRWDLLAEARLNQGSNRRFNGDYKNDRKSTFL